MILAIDTSAAQCAVALTASRLGEGAPVAERQAMERGHAEHLFPMIEAVLATAGAVYRDLSRIAVCTGPGSFTGVRIGVAAARGLALGRGIPAIGISRFEALATEALASDGGPVAVCLAGRGGTVYLQCFGPDGAALAPPEMVDAAVLDLSIPPGCTRFAGDAAPGSAATVANGLPDPVVVARLAAARAPGPLPAPLYLRGADAEPPREGPPRMLD